MITGQSPSDVFLSPLHERETNKTVHVPIPPLPSALNKRAIPPRNGPNESSAMILPPEL